MSNSNQFQNDDDLDDAGMQINEFKNSSKSTPKYFTNLNPQSLGMENNLVDQSIYD